MKGKTELKFRVTSCKSFNISEICRGFASGVSHLLLLLPLVFFPLASGAQEQDQGGFPIANPLGGQLSPYSQGNSSQYSGDTSVDSQNDSQDYLNRGMQSGQSSSSVLRGGDLQTQQESGSTSRRDQLLRDECFRSMA
jgi:hypothetical protein